MDSNKNILEALDYIDVSTLSYSEWIAVGMALKSEGFSCSVWDNWSKNDSRYKANECERKWDSFNGSKSPITGATIMQMAKDRGYLSFSDSGALDWNDEILYDGKEEDNTHKLSPTEQLITYLETLFHDDEYVGYVTDDVWNDGEKYNPGKGYFDRTAGELIASLKKHKDDIGAVIGDWKECGAWIRFNPIEGGVKNENVTRFGYALVECDEVSLVEQEAAYKKYELPIACLVYSGGKSLHAIVKIDAPNFEEYRKRVGILYSFLENHGLKIDKQNKNPSRLSRMPGVTRNGKEQTLLATNIGRTSWNDWLDFLDGEEDELAGIEYPADLIDNRPPLAPELIGGLLRKGHKMIVSGASKSGKSFLLIELAISISEGLDFLDFKCQKSNVLYVNLEIDRPSCFDRIFKIYDALGIKKPTKGALSVWNLRGHAMPLDKLVPKLIRRTKGRDFDCIIIDPIYKVITGDENNASEMGYFCNQFDRIADETGASVIYAHHHSKGAQGGKTAQDRSSGSGVFARDPDAIVDLIEVEIPDEQKAELVDDQTDTAWRMSFVTRDFAEPKNRNIWFKYPLHVMDKTEKVKKMLSRGDPKLNLKQFKDGSIKTNEDKLEEIEDAFNIVAMGSDSCDVKDIVEYLSGNGDKPDTIRRKLYRTIKEIESDFVIKDGVIFKGRKEGKK